MSAFESGTVQRKITRGAILKILNESEGLPMMAQTLEHMLEWIGGDVSRDMLSCVNFLLDRGYVRVWNEEEKDLPFAPDVRLCITANGQDVLDGTVKDLGVIIPREGRR
mgnify:FL=1